MFKTLGNLAALLILATPAMANMNQLQNNNVVGVPALNHSFDSTAERPLLRQIDEWQSGIRTYELAHEFESIA